MEWVVKEGDYYWAGFGTYDQRQTAAARFRKRDDANTIAAQFGGNIVKLKALPTCPLCQTSTLVRRRRSAGRMYGPLAISAKCARHEIPDNITIPECQRCFRLLPSSATQRKLITFQKIILRRILDERVDQQ